MTFRKEKLESLLTRLISGYILIHLHYAEARITITRLDLSPDFRKAIIFVTIEPDEKPKEALHELKKLLSPLRKHIGKILTIRFIPMFEFRIDEGEKHRARIEELIRKASAEAKPAPKNKKKKK
ncbi:MAG: ribosome-binding factor A [bacterium]|nr:ribosome-binding factor A [bacterium]